MSTSFIDPSVKSLSHFPLGHSVKASLVFTGIKHLHTVHIFILSMNSSQDLHINNLFLAVSLIL
jgi:hypothetical protein